MNNQLISIVPQASARLSRSMSSLQILRLAARTQPRSYLQSQFPPRRVPAVVRAPLTAYVSTFTADREKLKDAPVDKDGQSPVGKTVHDTETFEEFTAR
jgi:hypothetical protein